MTVNNVINTAYPWPISAGGTSSTGVKNILQQVTGNITFANSTTIIPFDNTKPQNTEGIEIGTATITPISASSVFEIYAICSINCAGAVQGFTLALFQDSGADSLQATCAVGGIANMGYSLWMLTRVASTSTSSTTFKFRAGGNAATQVSINGYNGSALFNGTADTPIIITELEA